MNAHRRRKGTDLLFFKLGANGDGWLMRMPSCFTPGKEPEYPLYRMLAGH